MTHHPPEQVEPFVAEDAIQRRAGALDPAPVGVDHRAIRKRCDERTPEVELGKGLAGILESLLGRGPVAGSELRHREELDDLRRSDDVAVIAIPLVLQTEARARRLEIVDPVEPDQRIRGCRACGAGLEHERLIEQLGIRPVPEHGLGDELVDQCAGKR